MPRKLREYLLRYADQADNDLERAFQRLALLEQAYSAPQPIPLDFKGDENDLQLLQEAEAHPEHAEMTRLLMFQITTTKDMLRDFRTKFM